MYAYKVYRIGHLSNTYHMKILEYKTDKVQ